MNGSLAIWYEPRVPGEGPAGVDPPKLELHFNLWRDLPSRTNFLDVGMELSRTGKLGRAYLFFPAALQTAQVTDLSTVLKVGQTLSAVFNKVVELGPQADRHYQTIAAGQAFVTVHHLTIGEDVTLEPVLIEAAESGTLLVLSEALCARIRHAPGDRHYLRFRIKLRGRSRGMFSNDLTAPDRVFVSSFHRLEVTEFRLNEQRSYPPTFASRAREHMFHISRLHYFLIRELGHELVMQHQPYRKVRRLEAKLWARYLQGEATDDLPVVSERVARRMVIYHWKEEEKLGEGGARPIEDFVAFASFRASTSSLLVYLIGILLLGALGNSVWDFARDAGALTGFAALVGALAFLMIVTGRITRDITGRLSRSISEATRSFVRRLRD